MDAGGNTDLGKVWCCSRRLHREAMQTLRRGSGVAIGAKGHAQQMLQRHFAADLGLNLHGRSFHGRGFYAWIWALQAESNRNFGKY